MVRRLYFLDVVTHGEKMAWGEEVCRWDKPLKAEAKRAPVRRRLQLFPCKRGSVRRVCACLFAHMSSHCVYEQLRTKF